MVIAGVLQGQERVFVFKGGITVACLSGDGIDSTVKEKLIQEREETLVGQCSRIGERGCYLEHRCKVPMGRGTEFIQGTRGKAQCMARDTRRGVMCWWELWKISSDVFSEIGSKAIIIENLEEDDILKV